jgi:hypothetical protein
MEIVDKHLPSGQKGFTLMPVGDIQYGAKGVAINHLKRDLARAEEDGWYLLGMGDYLDNFSPSNRAALAATKVGLHESAQDLIDGAVHDRVSELAKILQAPKGRWLGIVQGDHEWTFDDGQPSDALLAKKLGAPYLGHSAIVRIFSKGIDRPFRIFVTHGRGASVVATGKTAHLERLASKFECDAVLMGHAHLRYGVVVERMIWRDLPKGGTTLSAEKRVLGITGSYLKGYEEHTSSQGWAKGSYVEKAAMAPVSLGHIRITAWPEKEEWGWNWNVEVTS